MKALRRMMAGLVCAALLFGRAAGEASFDFTDGMPDVPETAAPTENPAPTITLSPAFEMTVIRPAAQQHHVCAVAPGVLGITGVETAELALGLAERVKPSAVIVVDALAAMETAHIGTTIQLTDTGIRPGSGVGNHRKGITAETMHMPVIAVGIPLVVYASTIVRDALADMMQRESGDAQALAEQLTSGYPRDFVVTPRNIDELVAGLADLLALAINSALQTNLEMEELSHCLH